MEYDIDIKKMHEFTSYGNDPLSYAQAQNSHLSRTGGFKGRYILAAIERTTYLVSWLRTKK